MSKDKELDLQWNDNKMGYCGVFNGIEVEIIQDQDPINPRTEYGHIGEILCWHPRHSLGDKHDYTPSGFTAEREEMEKEFYIFPLYLYEHTLLAISLNPFTCPWDSGQIGWWRINKDKMRKEWGEISQSKAKEIAEREVQEYDQYLRGDVWGWVIDPDGDNESCWGYCGLDYAEKSLLDKQEEKQKRLKTLIANRVPLEVRQLELELK